jgi:hypothetical protein
MACQTFLNGDVGVTWIPLSERGTNSQRSTEGAAATTASAVDGQTGS